MQISKSFLVVCAAAYCTALLPLRAADADTESAKPREALQQKMKELETQPPAQTTAPARASAPASAAAKPAEAKPQPTASKPEVKPTAEKAPKSPAAVKNAPAFPPIQAPPPTVSADKQQRLADLLRKDKAEELTPEEYHQQRAKIMSEP